MKTVGRRRYKAEQLEAILRLKRDLDDPPEIQMVVGSEVEIWNGPLCVETGTIIETNPTHSLLSRKEYAQP